jgi:biopolymer transport protein ExbD
MSFGSLDNQNNKQPMAEINTTPLVDVMLVLLVIFIITAPLFTHAIKLELPSAQAPAAPEKPETITLAIDPAGKLYWNNDAVATDDDLKRRLSQAALKAPQPDIQLRADKDTRYQRLAEIMSAAQQAGLGKIGFVMDPKADLKADLKAAPASDSKPAVK